jgi:EAL domain-containing protein (putative c-di-GMP-specific phosphodiesterase class I)
MRAEAARQRLAMAALAAAALGVLVAGAILLSSLLATSVYREAQRNAGEDARLTADLGLTAALADGRLTRADRRIARSVFAAARRSHPLTGIAVWTTSGAILWTIGDGNMERGGRFPAVVRAALAARATRTAGSSLPGVGRTVEAGVPVHARGRRIVAQFVFSRRGVEQLVTAAKRRVYLGVGLGALFFYAALLPSLIRLARRLPPRPGRRRRRALAELRRAVTRYELLVHYQPKVRLETRETVGVEALARWAHPERGMVGPAEFIALAEDDHQLLADVTSRILDCAVRDCARWQRNGRELPVAVNISAPMLRPGPLVQCVRDTLARHDLDPRFLTLEITESAIMEHGAEAVAVLSEVRALGVAVSIDDFGTGYSSLARLRSFPPDELKIDRAFVHGLATEERNLALVRLIVDLGADLGLRVVAEGVEDEATLALLESLGCRVAQGYLFAAPLPELDLLQWLDGRLAPA